MTTIRFTNDMRERTVRAVMETTFAKRHTKLRDEANKLAQRVLKHSMGQKLYDLMVSLPDGWLTTRSSVKVELAGTVQEFFCDEFRVPCNKDSWNAVLDIIDRADALCSVIENHVQALKDLSSEEKKRRVEINAVLNSATTIAKLLEMWPEVEQFLPLAAITQIDRTVPVVQIQALNAALGLGKRSRAA